ncbi:MAG: site-specific DNA-methyltransferase [Akkermansiaceae bacterium]|nr:site-specific DNA-methyltransferase [Akkermansiaceae bacterium]
MSGHKQKLELTWIGKDKRPRLEPRILIEDPKRSYHAKHRVSDSDLFDNLLIKGDNLLGLKALEQKYAGDIMCVYIDPPFNTGEAFEHYDDGVEHSLWLSLMRDRISLIHTLLHPSGTLVIHIDDNELCYLGALADEVFGRSNRINIVTFKQSSVSGPKSINPGLVSTSNYILIYAKNRSRWKPRKIYQKTNRDSRYSRFISNRSDHHTSWKLITLKKAFAAHHGIKEDQIKSKFADKLEEKLEEFVLSEAPSVVRTARVADKDVNESAREALIASRQKTGEVQHSARDDKADYYFLNGEQLIFYSSKTQLIDGELTTAVAASNLWDDLLSNNLHKEGDVSFKKGKKPEALIKRVIEFATDPGDLVLDSFLGSGTTAAVAHKMGRRWIGIELGEHCETHCLPRLKHVVDGKDPSGVTKATNWKGGGGFRFYRLAPSLIKIDQWGNSVINPEFNPELLAEAVCKVEGFGYAPSQEHYWQHGNASETDFIYVTTQTLTRPQLEELSEAVGPDRSLLVCCAAFRVKEDSFPNLTLKKIPKAVLHRCEWDHDDYSLRISNLPAAPPKSDDKGQIELL